MNWEQIDDYYWRAQIEGGWLVKAYESVAHVDCGAVTTGFDLRVAICFVPDPRHIWKLA